MAACSAGTATSETTSSTAQAAGSVDLSDVCPAKVVIQTNWNPEAEHGPLYNMLGDDYTVDSDFKSVTGPLYSGGEYAGVDVEVRAGGPAIGYQLVSSIMYQDEEIMLGIVTTDESVMLSGTTPTTAVFAPFDKGIEMVMWDPETYPDAETIQDVTDAGAVVRFFPGSAPFEYLIASGVIPEDQADSSYDGTPAVFVAEGGAIAQQGYVSSEPYLYENEIAEWGKPVDYQLLYDAGWEAYTNSLVVRQDALETNSACLQKLVPVIQQSTVDYFADTSQANALILELVDEYDTGWVYTQGSADAAVTMLKDLDLVSNGTNEAVGDFDESRMGTFVETSVPLFSTLETPPADGLVAEDIYTNEFIDPTIGF